MRSKQAVYAKLLSLYYFVIWWRPWDRRSTDVPKAKPTHFVLSAYQRITNDLLFSQPLFSKKGFLADFDKAI